jgi:amidophosphoribosyltransferase
MGLDQIPAYLGLDSLGYNTFDDLVAAVGLPREQLCLSCWTGEYF